MNDTTGINDVLKLLDPAVWLLTAEAAGRRGGLVATFVNQASIVPDLPRVVVGLAKQHHTAGLVAASREFVLHLLDESQVELAWRFGLHTGRDMDKLAGLSVTTGSRLTDAPAWLACRAEAAFDIGDRTLYIAEVTAGRIERPFTPLTMQRLLAVASPEQMAALRDGLQRDAAIDAAAIQAWRTSDAH